MQNRKEPSIVNEKYKSLYTSKKRYFMVTGGRGSGKSHSVNEYLVRLTFERGHGILFTRFTMTSAEKSIIPELEAAITRLGVNSSFKITKDKITNLVTGSFIIFAGIKAGSGSNTANLKSLHGITTFVVEEAEDIGDAEDAFDKVDNSVRTKGQQNRVILIMNPTVTTHFAYERWFKYDRKYIKIEGFDVLTSSHEDVEHIHTTYHDAKEYLDDTWLKKASTLRERDPEKYKNVYLGGWLERQEGAIYKNWEIGEFDTSLPHGFGLDFGSKDPDALVKCAIDNKRGILYIDECIYQTGLSTKQLVDKILLTTKGNMIVADSAGKRTIHDLEMEGVGIVPVKKFHGSILAGIQIVQNYQIVVTSRSENVIKELQNYIWSNRMGQIPVDVYNHALDAVRYYAMENTYDTESVWL